MINIKRDITRKNRWYAVTDKGVIYGGTMEIVQRKIDKMGAKEKTYAEDNKRNIIAEQKEFDLPF